MHHYCNIIMEVTGTVSIFLYHKSHWHSSHGCDWFCVCVFLIALPNIPCAIELFRVRASLSRSRTRDRERDRATERDRETDSERERSCASQATISQHLHSVLTGYHLLPPPPPSSPEEINEPANFNSFISHHSLLLLAPVSCSFPPISSLRLVLSPSLHS